MSTNTNLHGRGAAMLTRYRGIVATELVEYRRGGSQVVDGIAMSFSMPVSPLIDADGNLIEWIGDDGLIAAEDLIIDGVQTTPEAFDRVIRTLPDGQVITYEAQRLLSARAANGDNTQCWAWSDNQRKNMRVHLKQIMST